MTVYEKIVAFDEEKMVEFLLRFANDTINQFSRFQLPRRDVIREFLDRECPGVMQTGGRNEKERETETRRAEAGSVPFLPDTA